MSTFPNLVPRGRQTKEGKIRVLIVDDSVVMRHLLREAMEQDPDIEVVGTEPNGSAALARIPVVKPDVVTLDIEMPEMDGLETLRHLRKRHPRLRTIMFSTLTTRGGAATFEALALGADDYVAKAANGGSLDRSLHSLRGELIPKLKQFFALPGRASAAPMPATVVDSRTRVQPVRVVGIGVSTGGPTALARLMPQLPGDFPLPILLVQHMPPTFTRLLAERLNAASRLQVEEATEGLELKAGCVYVAPGDYHLRVKPRGSRMVTVLDQAPQENSCRPSVDVLFRSLAQHYRGGVLSVVLTGMGSDGLRGTEALKAAGARCLVQDEASSVVWGMPGAIAVAGLADRVLPLDQIAPEIIRLTAS